MPQSDTAFARALARMSLAEIRALWAAIADGRLDGTLPPRERLAAWHRRQKAGVFMDRFSRLPATEMSSVYLRLAAGDDPDEVLKEVPRPASDDAGPSQMKEIESIKVAPEMLLSHHITTKGRA